MKQHDEIEELLGAYALDAVDPDERDEIERHLATCPRCRAEVAEHREVAAVLGYAGSDAPPGLWDRIAAGLEEPPPALQLTRVVAERPGSDGQGTGGTGARVVPIGSAKRSMGMRVVASLAAVAALAAAILGIEVQRLNTRTENLRSSIGIEAIASAYKTALANPGARKVTMTSGDGIHTVAAVILPDGTAYLGPDNLPALPSSETYQLWGVVGSDKVSLAVLGNTPRLTQFGAPNNMSALAVTAEQAGGVVVSQHSPVVSGRVPTTA
jgi:anti-sigma factor RsiW